MSDIKLQFKTTINCGGCVAKVKPILDAEKDIEKWSVDTENPDKILTVEGAAVVEDAIVELIEDLGFDIERVKE